LYITICILYYIRCYLLFYDTSCGFLLSFLFSFYGLYLIVKVYFTKIVLYNLFAQSRPPMIHNGHPGSGTCPFGVPHWKGNLYSSFYYGANFLFMLVCLFNKWILNLNLNFELRRSSKCPP